MSDNDGTTHGEQHARTTTSDDLEGLGALKTHSEFGNAIRYISEACDTAEAAIRREKIASAATALNTLHGKLSEEQP